MKQITAAKKHVPGTQGIARRSESGAAVAKKTPDKAPKEPVQGTKDIAPRSESDAPVARKTTEEVIAETIEAREIALRSESGAAVVKKTPEEVIDEISAAVGKTPKEVVDAVNRMICKVTCTTHRRASDRLLAQVAQARIWPSPEDSIDSIIRAFASIDEMEPQNGIQARLAVQMNASNDAALMFLNRSVAEGQSIDVVDANVGHAARLMRLYLQQAEAMQKLKGKAAQVSIDQVHVHQGGQAIVGSATTSQKVDHLK